LTKDNGSYLSKIHFSAEGEISFRSVLFIPKKAEYGLYDKFYEKSTSLKLYVRKVLISDQFEDFLPRYMNFVKGVVDSDDLPLNVSRETLAQSRVLKVMSRKITRKVLEMLRKLAEAEEDEDEDEDEEEGTSEDEEDIEIEKVNTYSEFWKEYGKSIKLGVIDDKSNKNKLLNLLRFQTSASDGAFVSLDSYVERMQDDQKAIYYITGESVEAVESSPFLERLKKAELEVIYMTDPLDEYITQSVSEFDGNPLTSVTKEGLKLGDEDEEALEEMTEEFEPLTEYLSELYGKKVEKVVVGTRITDSPAVLVTGQYGWTANMERIMKAQTFSDKSKMGYMAARKTMEINPYHPIINALKDGLPEEEDGEVPNEVVDAATLLLDAALVSSGFDLDEPMDFSRRLNKVISTSLKVADAPMREYIPKPKADPEEEEEEEAEIEDDEDDEDEGEEDEPSHSEL
jgi:heat shock protein beta